MLLLTVASFAAGVLTVLAPCVLPLLPVIVGGTAARTADGPTRRSRPFVIALSLAVSVVAFTLLLKASTALLGVPLWVWALVSGGLVAAIGVTMLAPAAWDRIVVASGVQAWSGRALARHHERRGVVGDVALGAALGPAFNSCSPTYALIVATVLPTGFVAGVLYTAAYAAGLALALLAIALAGTALVRRLGWLADPHGWFRRTMGALLILTGLGIVLGLDRMLQSFILDRGWYAPIEQVERSILSAGALGFAI
ncbi:MAG: cytochrome C biogenesis protein [Microbacterium sp.]|uniref:cytochrome c biogenesis protein CcdA n=1 Tax=unclassified Microbacterium TaxID=2609290 RepID=UPI000DB70DD4|nr:cytochrome c biogenesis protein CcdA [Microbacterium sp.]PZU40072.1 MAG: cytochrome C biogenesis protein [Microbacterium sp.]